LNFADPRLQGIESLRHAADRMLSTPEGDVIYQFEGIPRYAIYRVMAFTGWKFAVGVKLGDSTSGGCQ